MPISPGLDTARMCGGGEFIKEVNSPWPVIFAFYRQKLLGLVSIEDTHAALCAELERLRLELKRLQGVRAFKDETLVYAARFVEDILRTNQRQSINQLKRLVSSSKVLLIGTKEVCRNDEVWMRIVCGNRRKIYRGVGMG